MNDTLRSPLALVGRVLLALMFVIAGVGKIAGFAGTVAYMQSAGLPAAAPLAVLVVLLEVGAGLALMLGYRTRPAALALAVFTLAASLVFHAFWAAPAAQAMVQNLFFMKNLSVAGGLLLLAALGPGAWSLDARRAGAVRASGAAVVHGA
jgi:putative oxidoreductase